MEKIEISDFLKAIASGVLISVGGTVYLSIENKLIAAVLFSVALLTICYLDANLYTGKINYLVSNHYSNYYLQYLLIVICGNLVGTVLCAQLISVINPNLIIKAKYLCDAKLSLSFPQTLIAAVFCGIMMYCAVVIFQKHKTPAGILFCIPVFILSGFEHSIADMFYFSLANYFTNKTVAFILCVILGNSIGSVLFSYLNES